MLGEPCSIVWRTCWLLYTGFYDSILAKVNILQTVVFFSLFIQVVSSRSNKPVVDVTLAKSEAVRTLGFEDQGWLIHRNRSTILKIEQPHSLTVFNYIEQPGH